MPTSPSDNGGKWRRPRSSISANSKRQRPSEDGEEDGDNEGLRPNPNSNANPKPAGPTPRPEPAGGTLRYTAVVRRTMDRIPPFVVAAAAADGSGLKQGGLKLENVSYGQLQALSSVPAENAALAMAGDQESSGLYVITPTPIMEGRGVVKRFWDGKVHVVPMHADWFCPNKVHRLERQVVPHFFSGKSAADHTSENYMEFRNLIVAKYMEHPEKRLTINDFHGMDNGIDEADMNRVFNFLEHWGIINYCVPLPDHKSWNIDSYLRADANGEVHLPSAALKSADSLIKFDKPKCMLKAGEVYSSLSSNGDNISDLENKIQEKLSEQSCNHCSQPLVLVYYQSMKEDDVMICLDCYHEGRFVVGHSSMDFSVVDSSKDHGDLDADSWTDQETMLLLEALEIYNDNWRGIAEHVGSKSKAQCILHFLRLPVEAGLLSNLDVPLSPTTSNLQIKDESGGGPQLNSNGHSAGGPIQDSDSYNNLPFMNFGNPVMSLVAFLASSVGPRVAAACAHASLAALAEDEDIPPSETSLQVDGSIRSNRVLQEGGSHSEIRNSGQHGEMSPLSAEKVKSAAKAGLVAAAIKAKLFADHEEREIQRLSANIINNQLKRLELKLKQFAEVESLLMNQCEQYEKTRQRFVAERAIYMASRSGPIGIPSTMNPSGVTPSMANTNTLISNRPMQLMSAASPSSQPSSSGFGNQMNHPNMPFMQRPAFSYGPHLHQPSSSSQSSNAMFNTQGTGQSSFGHHPMLRPVPETSSGLS